MATSSYITGIEKAHAEGAITAYGARNGQGKERSNLLPAEAFAPLPSLYHAVMTKAPGDFACLMIQPGVREAAEAHKFSQSPRACDDGGGQGVQSVDVSEFRHYRSTACQRHPATA